MAGAEPVLFRLIMMRDGSLLHVLYCAECIDDQKKREDKLLYLAQTETMTEF